MTFDWKKALSEVAPVIGGAVSGPFGPLVAAGISAVSQVLLGKPDGTEEEVAATIGKGLTPEQIAAFKKADQDFQVEIRKLDTEDKKIDAADRDSARGMQKTALQQDDRFAKRFIYYYALFVTVSTVIYIFAITFGTVPEKNQRFADTVLGFLLGTLLATIVNFFFGSSSGSGHKTSIITELLKRQKAATD